MELDSKLMRRISGGSWRDRDGGASMVLKELMGNSQGGEGVVKTHKKITPNGCQAGIGAKKGRTERNPIFFENHC